MSENKSKTGGSDKVEGGQRGRLEEGQRGQKGQQGQEIIITGKDNAPPPPPPDKG
jgi:hypothetical protein